MREDVTGRTNGNQGVRAKYGQVLFKYVDIMSLEVDGFMTICVGIEMSPI